MIDVLVPLFCHKNHAFRHILVPFLYVYGPKERHLADRE
jgi:hypothetical protein